MHKPLVAKAELCTPTLSFCNCGQYAGFNSLFQLTQLQASHNLLGSQHVCLDKCINQPLPLQPSTATLYKSIKILMKQPRSPLLMNTWLVSIMGATVVTVLCCFLLKCSCCSDFCRVQPSTRKAMTSVIPIFLLPLLLILIFPYSIC